MKNSYMYICTGIGINGYYNYVKKFYGKIERIRRISKKNNLPLNTFVIRCNSKHLPASFLSISHVTTPRQRKLLKILNARIDCKILVNKKKSFLSNQLDPPNLTIIQITTKTQPNN